VLHHFCLDCFAKYLLYQNRTKMLIGACVFPLGLKCHDVQPLSSAKLFSLYVIYRSNGF